jgi:uncharacterized membrane protein YhaH (DUF805 family)
MQHLTALLFSVRGRIGRVAFCVTWLIAMAFIFAPILLLYAGGLLDTTVERNGSPDGAVTIIVLLALVVSAWAQIAVYVKRFHDFGWRGIAAVLGFIPIVAFFAILGLMLWPGARERNQFGQPPEELFDIGRPDPIDSEETQTS